MAKNKSLKEKEIEELNRTEVIEEEVPLEDLIVLGEDKKIPIHIIYPTDDGGKRRTRALIKQLTLKETETIKTNDTDVRATLKILNNAFFKTNGDAFTPKELKSLPIGVIRAVSNKILEISGVDKNKQGLLEDF